MTSSATHLGEVQGSLHMISCFSRNISLKTEIIFLNDSNKKKINQNKSSNPKCLVGSSSSWSYGSWIYNYLCNPGLWRGVLYKTLCDKVCQWLSTGLWFSPGTLVFSTNKTDRHDITEILLKVVLNTINPPPTKKSIKHNF